MSSSASFITSVPFPALLYDGSRLILINQKAQDLFGIPMELISENLMECGFHDYVGKVGLGAETSVKWTFYNVNRQPINVLVSLKRLEPEINVENPVAVYITDNSEKNVLLSKLKDTEERMKAILDAIPVSSAFINDKGEVIDYNQEAVKYFDLTGREEYMRRYYELSPEYQPDGRQSSEKAREYIKMAFESGYNKFEWMHQTFNGELLPAEVTLVRIKDDNGYILASFVQDLRELKKAIDALNKIGNIAFTDGLTGLYNRRYFMDRLNLEFMIFESSEKPISLIMYDLDLFKLVNDTYGHPIGDEVLKQLSERVRGALRSNDLLARYGGEEFMVLTLGSTLQQAEKLAWRMQEAVASEPFECGGHKLPITISLGVATKRRMQTSLDELIRCVDDALYMAKNNGRNRVETCKEDI